MSWLKIDDAIGEHRKTRRLLRAGGTAAFGLHALALVHCSRYLTDGHIEAEFVEETLDAARVKGKARTAATDALVAHGQWRVVDGGWVIHDYLDHNPSRAEVEERRRKDADRKAKGRGTQAGRTEDSSDPGTDVPRDVHQLSARTDDGVREESDGPVPSPSRPVPEQPPHPLPGEPGLFQSTTSKPARPKHGGKPVNDLTARRLHRALVAFDQAAGTGYAEHAVTAAGKWSANASRVLSALAAYPELDEARCAAVIRTGLDRDAYWAPGKPEPRHVFGDGVIGGLVEATANGAGGEPDVAAAVAATNARAEASMA